MGSPAGLAASGRFGDMLGEELATEACALIRVRDHRLFGQVKAHTLREPFPVGGSQSIDESE